MITLIIWLGLHLNAMSAPLKKVADCRNGQGDKHVLVVKQWHLPPTTVTKGFKEKYPQEMNQTEIFNALEERIKKKKLDLVIAEGCEGEIDENFKRYAFIKFFFQ